MKHLNKYFIPLSLVLAGFISSCEKEFDSPPVTTLPEGNIITIDSVRNMYTAVDTTIDMDLSVYGVVTADEVTGNIYKTLFIQDETNAIQLDLSSSSSNTIFIGDRIRVSLKNTTITRDNSMVTITDIDPDQQIVKQESGMDLTPEKVSISDLAIVGAATPYQGKLVRIDSVEFPCDEIFSTWADAITQFSENRNLKDENNNSLLVRTSGYSTFAGDYLPRGNGSIIGIVTQYNNDVQLVIRNPNELTMTSSRFTDCPWYVKNFEDQNPTSDGWEEQNVIGNVNWYTNNQGSNNSYYGVISNFSNGSNSACETWLVSKAFDLTELTDPLLSFQSAYNYSGAALELYVSTDYTGDVTTSTWTNLTSQVTWSSGSWSWVNSGSIDISSYQTTNTRFAFKYTGSSNDGSTWEIDDFTIEE